MCVGTVSTRGVDWFILQAYAHVQELSLHVPERVTIDLFIM